MRYSLFALWFLLILLSCKNEKEGAKPESSEINSTETSQKLEIESSTINRVAVIEGLQGKWKEPEYPFRQAEFKDSLVKFIEEGVAEEPAFRKFRIAKECPFEVNNIKNVEPDDIILVMVEAETCEKLEVSKNTLTLSGFSAHTGREYQIVYKRME